MNDDPLAIARAIPKVVEASINACADLSAMQLAAVFRSCAEVMQQTQVMQEIAQSIARSRKPAP
jgi:hypothetical protein